MDLRDLPFWSRDALSVTPEGDTRVYKVAREGDLKFGYGLLGLGLVLAAAALLFWRMGVEVLVLLAVLGGPFALMTLGTYYGHHLKAMNSRVVVADAGVTVIDAHRRERFFPAPSLVSVAHRDFNATSLYPPGHAASGRLLCGVHGGSGRVEQVRLAEYTGRCPQVIEALREDLIATFHFREVPPKLRTPVRRFLDRLSALKTRTWA